MGIAITFLSDIQAGKARAFDSRVSAAALERVLSRRFLGRWRLEAADYPCWLVTSERQACSAAISLRD